MLGLAHTAYNYFKNYQKMAKYGFKRGSRRSRRNLLPANLQSRGKTSHRRKAVPKSLQVPRQSQGVRFWPRLSIAGPFPRSKSVKLVYTSEQISLSNSIGGVVGATRNFCLNGLFDPDLTGVGHQPMGFDQWAAFYNLYKVYKVDVKIRPLTIGNTASNSFLAAQVNASQDATPLAGATYGACCERRNCATRMLSGLMNDDVVYRSFWINEIEGHNIVDDNYGASTGGNPGNQTILKVGAGNVSATDTGDINVLVELVYHVVFYNPRTLQQS